MNFKGDFIFWTQFLCKQNAIWRSDMKTILCTTFGNEPPWIVPFCSIVIINSFAILYQFESVLYVADKSKCEQKQANILPAPTPVWHDVIY